MAKLSIEDLRQFEKKSYAKLEFLALEPECRELLAQGLSRAAIFRYLSESQPRRMSMCYETFVKYIKRRGTANAVSSAPSTTSPSAPAQNTPAAQSPVIPENPQPQTKGRIVPLGQTQQTFTHDPKPQNGLI